jgi:exodeoxyribonuclease VII large subunit
MTHPAAPDAEERIYSVTEITREIKRLFRDAFSSQWIEGELSGYKRHTSGHHYFTLKDAGAQLSCAMWRSAASRLSFRPEEGMKVQAWGLLDVYEPAGRYQLIVSQMRPAGVGELQKAFEELKKKLQQEGLFALERKRALPEYPEIVGLVTSETGAALQDMRQIAARRWPAAKLILRPVRVQGVGAADQIAAAIREFSAEATVDVIVAGRGGGSLEDLWAFNEEVVAHAIFDSAIPVVSAVGHEVDFTIADLVADLRAPTPSAAMELVLPDRHAVAATVLELHARLYRLIRDGIRVHRGELDRLASHWALREPVNAIRAAGQRADDLQSRLLAAYGRTLYEKRIQLNRIQELMAAFHPQAVLDRGYAIVRGEAGEVLRDAAAIRPQSAIGVTLARGRLEATVVSVHNSREKDHA